MTDMTTVPTELLNRLKRVCYTQDLMNRQISIDYALDDLFTWLDNNSDEQLEGRPRVSDQEMVMMHCYG